MYSVSASLSEDLGSERKTRRRRRLWETMMRIEEPSWIYNPQMHHYLLAFKCHYMQMSQADENSDILKWNISHNHHSTPFLSALLFFCLQLYLNYAQVTKKRKKMNKAAWSRASEEIKTIPECPLDGLKDKKKQRQSKCSDLHTLHFWNILLPLSFIFFGPVIDQMNPF